MVRNLRLPLLSLLLLLLLLRRWILETSVLATLLKKPLVAVVVGCSIAWLLLKSLLVFKVVTSSNEYDDGNFL